MTDFEIETLSRLREALGVGHKIMLTEVTILPDGSAFGIFSMPLPSDHWLLIDGDNVPPMGMRMGTDNPSRKEITDKIRAAARYAVRCATLNGKENDFDPDALVQNMIVGLLGYHTKDGYLRVDALSWRR